MRENGADVGVGGSTRGRGSARGRGAGWSNTASQDQQAIWSSAGRPIGDTRQNQRRTVSDLMSHHNGPLPIAHTISMDPSITRRPQGKSQLVSGASHAVGGLSGSSTNASRIPKKPFVQRHSKSEYLPERLQGDDPYESDRHHETLKLIRRRPDESHIRTVPSKPPSPPLSKKWSYTRPLPSTLADDADLQPIASSKMEQLAASFLRTSDDPSNNVRPLENGRIRVGAAFLRGATTSTSTSTSSQGLTGEFRGGSAFSMPGLEPRDAGLETFRGEGAAETERRLQEKYGQIGDNHESRSLGPQKELGSRSNGYIYIPPAAAKYFLWDNTPVGDCIIKKKAYPSYTRCIVRDTARSALIRHVNRLHQSQSSALDLSHTRFATEKNKPLSNLLKDSDDIVVGFFLCRVVGIGQHDAKSDRERSKITKADDGDGVAYASFLVADRFDTGRKVNGVLSPSFTMDTDVVIDVLFSERSDKPGLNTFKHLLYGFEETELKTPRNLSYPIAIHCSFSSPESPEANINDEHQHLPSTMVFSLRHLVPDVKMEITPIHPLLLVPSALSTSLLVESEEAPDQVSYGYVTIDQSRHILPLTATDKDVEALPLIGIWIKNVGNPKSSMVYSLCCQFISNSKLNRLDTGKSIMLLVLVPPNRTKALPHFYEVFYYESEYRFSLFGDGPRRSDTIGDGSQDTLEHERDMELGFDYIYVLDDIGLCMALEEKFNLKLPYKLPSPVEDPPILSDTNIEATDLNDNENMNESELKKVDTSCTEDLQSPGDANPSSATLTSNTTANPIFPALPDYAQQQKAYLELMERQIALMRTGVPTMPLGMPPFNPYYSLMPPSQLLPPTFGYPYDLGQVAMRQGLMADANAHRASVSSNRCSPSPAETRSIGTNTSIVFETKLATKVDRGANTTFAGGKAESESAIKTVVEKVTGTSMQLASREPFTVATSCMADLEKSMEKANLENYRPPADTGTNYMPFYTYEPFEEREIDFGDPPPPQTDSKKDTFDFSKEIDITGEDDEDSMRRRSHVREAMFQPLLDISKIGDTSFFGRSMDTNLIEEPKWAEDQKEQATVETKEDDDIRERTMELIAKLADNPEKSFILIDENKRRKNEVEAKENEAIDGSRLLRKHAPKVSEGKHLNRRTSVQSLRDSTNGQSFVFWDQMTQGQAKSRLSSIAPPTPHNNSRFGDEAPSDEYSIGTLTYLRKYNLIRASD